MPNEKRTALVGSGGLHVEVSVVIPTYNRKTDVFECLQSVRHLQHPAYEIVVVDNASTDGTNEMIRRLFHGVAIVRSSTNLGVTGGRNLGAKHARGIYLFFLDHDTVVDRNVLNELLGVMKNDPTIGIAGPAVYYYEDSTRIWALGTSIDMRTGRVSFNHEGEVDNGQFRIMDVQVLPTAFIVRADLMKRIGWFDDVFYAVYEDTDFCFRARELGYRVVCVPQAKVWHKVSADASQSERMAGVLKRAYYVARNRIVFMRKHARPHDFLVFLTIFVAIYLIVGTVYAIALRRSDFLREYYRGTLMGLLWVARHKGTERPGVRRAR